MERIIAEEELKPCPFCGGMAGFFVSGSIDGKGMCYIHAKCRNVTCGASVWESSRNPDDPEVMMRLADKWNRRQPELSHGIPVIHGRLLDEDWILDEILIGSLDTKTISVDASSELLKLLHRAPTVVEKNYMRRGKVQKHRRRRLTCEDVEEVLDGYKKSSEIDGTGEQTVLPATGRKGSHNNVDTRPERSRETRGDL